MTESSTVAQAVDLGAKSMPLVYGTVYQGQLGQSTQFSAPVRL